jgi:hypothetical protein
MEEDGYIIGIWMWLWAAFRVGWIGKIPCAWLGRELRHLHGVKKYTNVFPHAQNIFVSPRVACHLSFV